MGSIYRNGQTGGSIYRNGGHNYAGPSSGGGPRKKKGGGGGFLGEVGHVFKQGAVDLKNAAVSSPAGIYNVGKAAVEDVAANPWLAYAGPFSFVPGEIGLSAAGRSHIGSDIVVPMAKQVATDIQHPLRHPGFTALDLLTVASAGAGGVARVAAAGRIARAGEGLGEASRALVVPPKPPPLILRADGFTVEKPAARAALSRYVQRTVNHYRNLHSDRPIGLVTQKTRVGRGLGAQRALDLSVVTSKAVGVAVAGRKIRWASPEGAALRAVAEGTTLDQRIALHEADLAKVQTELSATDLRVGDRRNLRVSAAYLKDQIKALVRAKEKGLVEIADGRPVIADPELAPLYAQIKTAALEHDARLVEAGVMSAEGAQAAINNPARVFAGATYDETAGALTGGEGALPGEFHVGYERGLKPSALRPLQLGSQQAKTMRVAKYEPARLRKPLTGSTLHEGLFRSNVPQVVAENIIEGERYLALQRAARFFAEHAQDTPEGIPPRHAVAIVPEELGHQPLPLPTKDFLASLKQQSRLGSYEQLLGLVYDDLRNRVFPQISTADAEHVPGVKWIDDRLLGGLNKPPLLQSFTAHPAGRAILTVNDAINNASKFAILYLKLGYVAPNMLGNAFLTLTHQGWAAPANLGRAVRLSHRLGTEDTALIDSLMGEGLTGSLAGSGEGPLGALTRKTARAYSVPVDLPFRRAAFLYEARKALGKRGTKTPWQEVHDLLHNQDRVGDLRQVTERANQALIDYGNLNPLEQALIRRVIFFYPWLKGSTRYAGHYVREHPIQAGVLGNLGQYGQAVTQQQLGDLPPWAQGYFRVGGSEQTPLVVNPTGAGILGQPAQLGEAVTGFFGPHPTQPVSQFLTPFFGGLATAVTGYDSFANRAVEPNFPTLLRQFYTGTPLVTLAQRLQHDQSGKTFPLSRTDALLQYLLGSVAPKPANLGKLHQSAAKARLPRR